MINDEFGSALDDIGALAGTIPPEVWERLRPAYLRLRAIHSKAQARRRAPEPIHARLLGDLDRLGIAPKPGLTRSAVEPVDDLTIRRLQDEIRRRIADAGLTGRAWCRENSVHTRDLSFLLNHFERRDAGDLVISRPKLAEFVQRFLGSQQAVGA